MLILYCGPHGTPGKGNVSYKEGANGSSAIRYPVAKSTGCKKSLSPNVS